MHLYTEISSEQTRAALRRLGEQLDAITARVNR
jgi:hypothetical protein